MKKVLLFISLISPSFLTAQTPLITNVSNRNTISLNGNWQYIIDPYETGFLDYRYKEKNSTDPGAYWNTDIPSDKTTMIEHGFTDSNALRVPGDWNSQDPKFLYYEGTVWYKNSSTCPLQIPVKKCSSILAQ